MMSKADQKLADEILDEAQLNAEDREEHNLPEAPASATVKFWIRGYGVLFTMRDEKANPLLKKINTVVEFAESHGWKNTWDKEEKPGYAPQSSQQPTQSQDECHHANVGSKKSSGYKNPANKDRVFNYCLDCNKFLGWKD